MNAKVDIWPKNAPLEHLLEASLTFKELHGSIAYVKFLQDEITREIVVREYHAANKVLGAATELAEQYKSHLDIALLALEFYAAHENHTPRNNSKRSLVAVDGGNTAREALATLSGENGEKGEE